MSAPDAAAVESGSAILGLCYWPQAADTGVHSSPARLVICLTILIYLYTIIYVDSEILKAFPLLLATTHSGLLAFNTQTMELVSMIEFKGIM